MHFKYYDLYGPALPSARTPAQTIMKLTILPILCRPVLVHHYLILIFVYLFLGIEKMIFIEKMHFRPRPSARIPAQEFMKVTILVDPSFIIPTIYLVCLIFAWE